MCPIHTERLPVELYRDIVSVVVNRSDLTRLLLVSAAFRYEAERALYRHVRAVDSKIRSKSLYPLLSCLESDHRLASLIRSLTLISSKPFPTGLQRISLRNALVGMVNLESFEISAPRTMPEATLGFVTKGVKFRLRTLRSTLPLRDGCMPFLSSQTDLVELDLANNYCSIPSSPSTSVKLPNLETLSIHSFTPGHFGCRTLTRLRCETLSLAQGIPMPSVKVLSLSSHLLPGHDLHRVFPNIVFLEAGDQSAAFRSSIQQVTQTVERLAFLAKLKLHQQTPHAGVVSQVLRLSASVQTMEIHPRFLSPTRFKRYILSDIPASERLSATDADEWRTFPV